jgi:hypothetical protein
MKRPPSLRAARTFIVALASLSGFATPLPAAGGFSPGDMVRLTRSETLMLEGKNFAPAPKGEDFSVLQVDNTQGLVHVSYHKDDGSVVAPTLPAEALQPSPPDPWLDLLRGVESFRDQRYDDAKRLLARAAEDPQYKPLATALATRINAALTAGQQARSGAPAARQAFANVFQGLRDAAEQLTKLGYLCLALPLDEGADRLGALVLGIAIPAGQKPDPTALAGLPPSKLNRDDVTKRVAVSNIMAARARQSIALHKLMEASKLLNEGLKAEPARPDLKAFDAKVEKDIDEADQRYKAADEMRRHFKGTVHALTAIEMGLKVCTDHKKLRELRQEMNAAFEERTSPPVNSEFLATAKVSTPAQTLEEGRNLYTKRCSECHDLEMVDSRTISSWQKAIAGMAGRAHVNEAQQARMLDYLTAALVVVDATK